MKRISALALSMVLLAALSFFCMAGCSGAASSVVSSANTVTTGEVGVSKDTNFGGVLIDMSQQEFADCGFEFGDSVDISFSNGKTIEDVPYYNGYYTATGDFLICSYPGEEHPNIRRGQQTFWDESGADSDTTVCVTLRERGAYLDTQEALSMVYSNLFENFATAETFANFRAVNIGNLKENILYRSASPIDSMYLRASYACDLAQFVGIAYFLNLSDNKEEFIEAALKSGSDCQYYIDAEAAGNVGLLDLSSNFANSSFKQTLASGIYEMCQHSGPYDVHCIEGKDRTGMVCMLLGALAGASVDELTSDYMITYDNYYGINKSSDIDKYNAVVEVKCNDLLKTVAGVDDIVDVNSETLQKGAENYLQEGGLSAKQISEIKSVLCK